MVFQNERENKKKKLIVDTKPEMMKLHSTSRDEGVAEKISLRSLKTQFFFKKKWGANFFVQIAEISNLAMRFIWLWYCWSLNDFKYNSKCYCTIYIYL